MQINSINPTTNLITPNASYLKQTNKTANISSTNPNVCYYDSTCNYSSFGINFKRNVRLNNLDKWVEQYDICKRTMESYKGLLIHQRDKTRLMSKLEGVIPEIRSTSHVLNYVCTDSKGRPIEYVIQSLNLIKDNVSQGHYDVQYDKNGVIIDSYLVFTN